MMNCILISLSLIALTAQSQEIWEYNIGPLNYEAARLDCIAKGGDLATIITDEDRSKASEAIGSGAAPWVGLYSNNIAGWWQFFDEAICPDTTSGACVSFWRYIDNGVHHPRCLDDGNGFGCTLYYGDDGYDNDKNCYSPAPYLCRDINVIPDTSYTGNYIAVKERFYWADAQKQCKSRFGTDLATILTDADMVAAEAALTAVGGVGGYIGLNDRTTEGVFEWIDGTPCTEPTDECSHLWRPGQPNDLTDPLPGRYLWPDSDCTLIWPFYGSGVAYEFHCTGNSMHAFICNRPDNVPAQQVIEVPQFDGTDGLETVGLVPTHTNGLVFNIAVGLFFVATVVLMVYNCCSCGNVKMSEVYVNSKPGGFN